MKQTQLRRLEEQLKDVLEKPFSMSTSWNDETQKVTSAKFNTKEHLSKLQIQKLEYIGERWEMDDYDIKRSGTGLTFSFKSSTLAISGNQPEPVS